MDRFNFLFSLIFFIAGLLSSPVKAFPEFSESAANKYKTLSATACDSLIKANDKNPDFVILDVRTPAVWAGDHLAGSICRNYYDADFSAQLNALPKNKIFLLHCQSGGRSGPGLALMKTQNFREVYEMNGGINAWKSINLQTTNLLAPRLMLVSNGGTKKGTIQYGRMDTLKITLTNRANDTLKFTSITVPSGIEFSSNFDVKKKLKGAEDYTFSVFYQPKQLSRDSVQFGIRSNGGDLNVKVYLKMGTVLDVHTISSDELKIYPNPASEFIFFRNFSGAILREVSVLDLNGQVLKKEYDFPSANSFPLYGLPEGIFVVRVVSGTNVFTSKLILSRQIYP